MEQSTELNEIEIREILAKFDIHNISSFELLGGGSENTNYLVKSENGKYVLCIFEQKTEKNAKDLAHLLKHLEKNNFNTSKLMYNSDSEPVIIWKDKPIIIKTFIEGKIRNDLSPHLLKMIGKELAKLHQINAPEYISDQLNYGKEQFVNVKKYSANSEFDIWLKNILEYIDPYLKLNLPKSIIHSDVFWDNVIVGENDNSATIIDFEESVNYYRLFDIGMTIIGICGEEKVINMEKTKHLLDGYQSEVQLLEEEINSLKAFTIYAGASMTFWRHQNFNYVKPNTKMSNHYMKLKVLVDDIVKQADDCFVRLIKN
ncbi:MAG: homoserine kinase [Flavobacteriaceae bacterium]|jgi:homoserine kinase type II|nr:homoserine kinase [Flavobacteriaceae bacterium]